MNLIKFFFISSFALMVSVHPQSAHHVSFSHPQTVTSNNVSATSPEGHLLRPLNSEAKRNAETPLTVAPLTSLEPRTLEPVTCIPGPGWDPRCSE